MKCPSYAAVVSVAIGLFGLFSLTTGQVPRPGRFQPYGFVKSGNLQDVVFEVPQLDNDALLKAVLEDELPDPLTHVRPAAPHKFAQAVDMQIDISNPKHGNWIEDTSSNRRTWRAVVRSPGALSISLLFSDFHLPEGGDLYVIGREEILGAFTAEVNNKDSRKFATTPLAGDQVIIEYHEPLHNKNSGMPPAIRVGKVVHGFRATPFAYGASGHCEVDVACRANSKNVRGNGVSVEKVYSHQHCGPLCRLMQSIRRSSSSLMMEQASVQAR